MKPVVCLFILGFAFRCCGQDQQPRPLNATAAVLRAFDTHDVVLFGEAHGCKQEYEWLRDLVATPEFADRVDDIVVEAGNSLYQQFVDRYVAGEDVPLEQVERAWRDAIGALGAPSPVYESFYRAVRAANLKRPGKHKMRVVLGGPPGDWDKIRNREEWIPFAGDRDAFYARRVKEEVLARGRRALLIMGAAHFRRIKPDLPTIEQDIRAAGANTWLIIFDTRIYDDPQNRFAAWPLPAIVDLRGNWVGDMPVFGAGFPGKSPILGEAADALLFIAHSRQELTELSVPRSELEGTAWARELDRRLMIINGKHLVLPEKAEGQLEVP
jgi:hypothetical protein